MGRFSRILTYSHQLAWGIERDKLDAHFCRFGSGFILQGNVKEAKESLDKLTQILTQYQRILESDTGSRPVEPPLLPVSEAQKSVPIYAHSKDGGNRW